MSHGNNTPNTKAKPTTPKCHDGTCQVVRCDNKIKGRATLRIEGGAYAQAAF